MFSNREIAIIIWINLFLLYCLSQTRVLNRLGKSWGKTSQKSTKNTQMFENSFPQFLLTNQLKSLISLNYKSLSTHSHNPKVDGSSPSPATKLECLQFQWL